MRTIGNLRTIIKSASKQLTEKIYEAQDAFCEDLKEEIRRNIEIPPESEALNPGQFEVYRNSIEKSPAEENSDTRIIRIYSDYTVFWPKKGISVPVGVFLEWGTGPLGESTNIYDHGYPYTTEMPWNLHAEQQFIQTGTWGIQARPHWWPAIMKYKTRLKEEIERRL